MPAALASLVAVAISGCVITGPGNQYIEWDGIRVGELHAQSGGANGYLVTIYANVTHAIRELHDGKIALRNGDGRMVDCGLSYPVDERDECTLRWLKTFDDDSRWRRATADDEAGDFHDALTGMPHRGPGSGDDCVAVHIKGSGENWTWRHGYESSCKR